MLLKDIYLRIAAVGMDVEPIFKENGHSECPCYFSNFHSSFLCLFYVSFRKIALVSLIFGIGETFDAKSSRKHPE